MMTTCSKKATTTEICCMQSIAATIVFAILITMCDADGDSVKYQPDVPTAGNTMLLETFQTSTSPDDIGVFVRSEMKKYKNKFVKAIDETDGLEGERSMSFTKMAKHYAVTAPFKSPVSLRTGTFVVQYEFRWPKKGQECGGGYIKLYSEEGTPDDLKEIDDSSPYVIMFGPDKCGGDHSKIHFILRHKNLRTGEYDEHHLTNSPYFDADENRETHVYTLVIRPNDTYRILVNNVVVRKGSLLEDMTPPLNPEKMIDDPDDTKPEDWVDAVRIPNPFVQKPDDWDAPMHIVDPNATMPEGWEEDEKEMIPDPDAVPPEEWDEEEDGEWEAPIIRNPKCSVGCGKWTAPLVGNPEYKGEWEPPMMDNPDYKGPWKPRKIENPKYFTPLEKFVSNDDGKGFDKIVAIGIEAWTMKRGMTFDNFLVTDSEEAAREFADSTALAKRPRQLQLRLAEEKRKKAEALNDLLDGSFVGYVMYAKGMTEIYPIHAACTAVAVLLVNMFLFRKLCAYCCTCCCGRRRALSKPLDPKDTSASATDATDTTNAKNNGESSTGADEKKDSATATDKKTDGTDVSPTVRKKKRSARRTPRAD